jgi:transcriptional regulator with XRE-family HTH domain
MLPNNKAIDRAIGQRLRAHRLAARMSQADLGKHLGVTFQQIQKYEKGTNRISGSRLVRLTELFNVKAEKLLGTNSGGPDDVKKLVVAISELPPALRASLAESMMSMVAVLKPSSGGSRKARA